MGMKKEGERSTETGRENGKVWKKEKEEMRG